MKIAFYNLTTTTKLGGIETFNWGMAKYLARRGHIVHIYGGNGDVREDAGEGVSLSTYPFISRDRAHYFGSQFGKFLERLSFALTSCKPLVKGRHEIIYISKPYDLPIALLLSRMSGARVAFGSGGKEFFPGYKCLANKVDYFFSCSAFNASQIEAYCGIRPIVLPNGVNTKLFTPHSPDLRLKSRLLIDDNEKIILSACRLVGWKGLRYAIEAVAELIRKGLGVKYLIAGIGEDRKNLEVLTKKLGIADNIIFLGSIRNSELPEYYSIADMAVYPSIGKETFGISIAEAMACGIPVISTRVGGIPEVVAEGTGLLVPPKDKISLAQAMETLLCDGELRKQIGNAGRRRVLENFSWDIAAKRLESYLSCNKEEPCD